jgi:hypothetical protein
MGSAASHPSHLSLTRRTKYCGGSGSAMGTVKDTRHSSPGPDMDLRSSQCWWYSRTWGGERGGGERGGVQGEGRSGG